MGRTKVYELLKTGELESVQIGSSRRIPAIAVAVAEYVRRLRATSIGASDISLDIPASRPTVPR